MARWITVAFVTVGSSITGMHCRLPGCWMSLRAAAVCGAADSGRSVDRELTPAIWLHILFLCQINIWHKGPDLLFAA
jgi:hypothetical protein